MREWTPPPHIATMTQISDFREIDEILRSKDFRQGSHTESRPLFADSLLLLDGPDHRERRRLENPLFDRTALMSYDHEALNPVVEQMVRDCLAEAGEDGTVTVDLVPLVRAMLHRIAAATTGIDGVDTPEATERFRRFLEDLGAAATVEWSTKDHDEVLAYGLARRAEFVEEFFGPSQERRKRIVEEFRAGRIAREDVPVDLLTLLHLHWDDSWDEEFPLREATLFLVAATQTTTHTLPHVIVHMEEWLRDHPEDADKRSDPDFLRLMVNESLRLHQPAPTLLRYATAAVTLATGREIAEGSASPCCSRRPTGTRGVRRGRGELQPLPRGAGAVRGAPVGAHVRRRSARLRRPAAGHGPGQARRAGAHRGHDDADPACPLRRRRAAGPGEPARRGRVEQPRHVRQHARDPDTALDL
ncbi:cytochrome P450 [Pseudonocardia benzenivorans]